MAKKRLVVGNWKMYIEKSEEAKTFSLLLRRKVRGLSGVDVYVAPPFTLISEVGKLLESSATYVGAQTVSPWNDSKHTGDISGLMLKNAGAQFVIIGHSECRAAGDTDSIVREQLDRVLATGLIPILCIGEEVRTEDGEHFSLIENQINSALKNIPKNLLKKLIVAYEPVWAIGKSATSAIKPSDLQEMVIFIRKHLAELLERKAGLKVPILYGGSVEIENASQLIQDGGVNGFLVGHASAHPESFLAIIEAAQK